MIDPNIYGHDDNAFAESISSKALGKPSPDAHSGAPIDQSAHSEGEADRPENPAAVIVSNKGDSRADSKGN